METMILGTVTRKQLNRAILLIRKNALRIKKITDTKVIDRNKVLQLEEAYKKLSYGCVMLQDKIEHWDDVIKE